MVKVYVMNADNEGLKRTEIDADLCVVVSLNNGNAHKLIEGKGTYSEVISLLLAGDVDVVNWLPDEIMRDEIYEGIKDALDKASGHEGEDQ